MSTLHVVVSSCGVEEALVSGNNPIPDAQITASSSLDDNAAPRQARINNTNGYGGWHCLNEHNEPEPKMYIQVCLLVSIKVIPSQTTN